ncbi:MAG: hypothetical protein JW708_10550 [Vallitaleaceae bacterium]|nr:hypothetical protein [Vallitaleaceae bacterium]
MSTTSYPTKLLLAFRSGDRCAFPGCDCSLTVDGNSNNPVSIGEAAHIEGENPTAARYNSEMTDDQRNHYNNLIYMCGTHHERIDKQKEDFPVCKLRKIKLEHEQKVREAINAAFADIGFPELAEATAWISRYQPQNPSDEFSILPPDAKIKKNQLTETSRASIVMGLAVSREVRAFVEQEAKINTDFPERLKAGFLEEYYRLKRESIKGDELFDLMCEFAQRGMKTQVQRSAGLAVLIYLFEACEVFEK